MPKRGQGQGRNRAAQARQGCYRQAPGGNPQRRQLRRAPSSSHRWSLARPDNVEETMQALAAGKSQASGVMTQMKPEVTKMNSKQDKHTSPQHIAESSMSAGWHAAQHQATHRISEKAAFGAAENILDHVTRQPLLAQLAQHGVAGGPASWSAWGYQSALGIGDSLFAANGTMHFMVAKSAGEQHLERGPLQSSLRSMRMLLPFIGAVVILHTTREDWHRAHLEWRSKGRASVIALFLLAAVCGTFDVLVHLAAGMDLIVCRLDHHLLHSLEFWSQICTGIAIMAVVLAERCNVHVENESRKVKCD